VYRKKNVNSNWNDVHKRKKIERKKRVKNGTLANWSILKCDFTHFIETFTKEALFFYTISNYLLLWMGEIFF
jgi:hypothetical protein